MDSAKIKNHLHQLIDETNDVAFLTELVEQIEEIKKGGDWWDKMSTRQQERILQSEEQYKNGKIISNEIVMDKIRQWLQK